MASKCRTGKRLYTAKIDAMLVVAKINSRPQRGGTACRYYLCEFCVAYHLTSQAKQSKDNQ